jgi:gliding motility-associated-like protein
VKRKYNIFLFIILFLSSFFGFGQNVSFYEQINGRYEFTFIGNTLNTGENNHQFTLQMLPESSAELNLPPEASVYRAYLYWAGSGPGDFEIKLNGETFEAERTFSYSSIINGLPHEFFGAFTDITTFVQNTGNGNYTFSDLDLWDVLSYYFTFRVNFAGWAVVIVYGHEELPLNQINIYDGFEGLPGEINITLDNLNVIDNNGSKIGFLAWEGDSAHATGEQLIINNNVMSNPPLNPANNAFNSTNSITGSSELYNMDLDIYDAQDNIQIGDETAEIKLTSQGDFVLIHTIITQFNSQTPDAVIHIDNTSLVCDSRTIEIDYTVTNSELATDSLPVATPISFYANEILIGQAETETELNIGESIFQSVLLSIPDEIPDVFELTLSVDDLGNGIGIIIESNEDNNTDAITISLLESPDIEPLPDLLSCNEGFTSAVFDFTNHLQLINPDGNLNINFYGNYQDAISGINPIQIISNYEAPETPKEIFVTIEDNEYCPAITSFIIRTKNCPPTVYNWVSANNDGHNDFFFIDGLVDIFTNFELYIYNRWGQLLWEGNQQNPYWRGEVNNGVKLYGKTAPAGTYYYLLHLNDTEYPEPLNGYLYITY